MIVKWYIRKLYNLWEIDNNKFFHELKNNHFNRTLFQWYRAHVQAVYNSYVFGLLLMDAILQYAGILDSTDAKFICALILIYSVALAVYYIYHYKLIANSDLKFEKEKYVSRDKDETIKLGK